MTTCDYFAPDLVAYLDHELTGARREFVEAHLQSCPVCRGRLRDMERTRALLQESTPSYDDPQARAKLRGLIAAGGGSERSSPSWWTRPLLVAGAALLIALIVFVSRPAAPTSAGFSLARFIAHFGAQPRPTGQGLLPAPAPAAPTASAASTQALDFPSVVPAELTAGLRLTGQAVIQPELLQLTYQGAPGHVVRLLESPADLGLIQIDSDAESAFVGDTQVLWQINDRLQQVHRAVWMRQGELFALQVLQWDSVGLPEAQLREVIARIMAVQDGT